MKTVHSYPPGPTALQVLKDLPLIQANPLNYLQHLGMTYGDLVRLPIGKLPVYIINTPDAIQHVLLDNHHNYTKNTIQYNSLRVLTGNGLLTADGEGWLQQRRLMQPAFAKHSIHEYTPIIINAVGKMLTRWDQIYSAGKPLDLDVEMMKVTLEVVGEALFSLDLSEETAELTKAVLTALDSIMYRARNVLSPPLFIPTPGNIRFNSALRKLDRLVHRIIRDRLESPGSHHDLLSMLVDSLRADGVTPSAIQQIRDEVITLLIAGHETVASSLSWFFYLLSKDPNSEQVILEELRGLSTDGAVTPTQLDHLPYLHAAYHEALRMYPPAWVITRRASHGDTLGGYEIEAGALIIIGTYAIHHHPTYWPNPDQFDPSRFMSGKPIKKFTFIPFGGGPRLCIGNNFALLEAPIVIAEILRRYHLERVNNQPIEPDPLITIRPKGGLLVNLSRR